MMLAFSNMARRVSVDGRLSAVQSSKSVRALHLRLWTSWWRQRTASLAGRTRVGKEMHQAISSICEHRSAQTHPFHGIAHEHSSMDSCLLAG
jgi:hypothetical protein